MSPQDASIKWVQEPELGLAGRLYVTPFVDGLTTTIKHFFKTVGGEDFTQEFPEERPTFGNPLIYRGVHRLNKDAEGRVKCVACFLCATACPAHCIFIEAGEHPDPHVEKFPLRYEIDTLRCIYCGMCVEACPCDAIRMDTYVHPKIWGYKRADFIETKEVLMNRSQRLAEGGRGALMKDLLEGYKRLEEEGPPAATS